MQTNMHPNSIDSYHGLNLTARQSEVVNALRVMGEATDLMLAEYLNLQINQITGRITELRDGGVVIECGSVLGRNNKMVRLCRLKDFQETFNFAEAI